MGEIPEMNRSALSRQYSPAFAAEIHISGEVNSDQHESKKRRDNFIKRPIAMDEDLEIG